MEDGATEAGLDERLENWPGPGLWEERGPREADPATADVRGIDADTADGWPLWHLELSISAYQHNQPQIMHLVITK